MHSPGKGGLSSTQEEEDKKAAEDDADGKFYHDLAPEVKLGDDQVLGGGGLFVFYSRFIRFSMIL